MSRVLEIISYSTFDWHILIWLDCFEHSLKSENHAIKFSCNYNICFRCPTENCNNLFLQPVKDVMSCVSCRKKVNLRPVLEELEKCEEQYQAGITAMNAGSAEKAIPLMCEALNTFHR